MKNDKIGKLLQAFSLTALTTLSTPSLLATASPQETKMGGAYLGGHMGYITGNSEVYKSQGANGDRKVDLSASGIAGGVHLGWGRFFAGNVYAGIELLADFSNLDGKQAINDGLTANTQDRTRQRMKDTFGGVFRFGMRIDPVLPYIKLGAVSSKWEINHNFNPGSLNLKKNKRVIGLDMGAGVDIPITSCLLLGIDYSFRGYDKVSFNTPSLNQTIEPQTNTVSLRLSYQLRSINW